MAFFLGPRRVIGLTPGKGGGVPNPIVTSTVMRDFFVMRDSIRMTDNG